MKKVIRIEQYRRYTNKYDSEAFSIVRVRNQHIQAKDKNSEYYKPGKFKSGSWVTITNNDNGKKVHRMVKGFPSNDLPENMIEIDSSTMLGELEVSRSESNVPPYLCSVSIRKSSLHERFLGHLNHPDLHYRYPIRVAIMGVLAGLLGFVAGILGLFF